MSVGVVVSVFARSAPKATAVVVVVARFLAGNGASQI
jgi:hypothetical protein